MWCACTYSYICTCIHHHTHTIPPPTPPQEAAVRALEDAAGFRNPEVGAASRRAEQLTELLPPEQRTIAAECRQGGLQGALGTLERVCNAFTEDLEVYAQPGSMSRAKQWDEQGCRMLPTLGGGVSP